MEYNRSVFATDLKDLKTQSSELYKEVKEQKGMVIYLSTLTGYLKDSISLISKKLKNGETTINTGTNKDGSKFITFKDDTIYSKDNERHISGKVDFKIKKDSIDGNSIKVNLETEQKFSITTGLEEDRDSKLLRIFVTPEIPNMKITKVNGALIDPQKSELIQSYFKPKRFTCGPQIGLGITTSLKPSIYIGFGIQYNLYWKDIKNLIIK